MTTEELHWSKLALALTASPVDALLSALDDALGDVAHAPALFLADYRRSTLTPYPDGPGRTGDEAVADAALDAGAALRADDLVALPIQHRADPLGVLVLEVGDAGDDTVAALGDQLAPLLALALTGHTGVCDRLEDVRRTRDMSLAAEIQWGMLPAPTHRDRDVLISAALEPAYDTGGDVFDYGRNGMLLRVAVLDAMGHGLHAATLSVAVTSALRLGRRDDASLVELADRMAAAVAARAGDGAFVTAVLVDIDLGSGDIEWLTAGHVPPLRAGRNGVEPLPHVPNLPLGVVLGDGADRPGVHSGRLADGESLVLYSDGVVDNLMAAGVTSPDDRQAILVDSVEHHLGAAPQPGVARSIVRETMQRTGPDLRDDATLMVVRPGHDLAIG